jgi:hypothetical protein
MAASWSPPAWAQEPGFVSLSLGVFDMDTLKDAAVEGRIDYHAGWKVFQTQTFFKGIGPMIGVMANSEGAVFGYGGIYADFQLTDRWVVWPSGGIGGYAQGDRHCQLVDADTGIRQRHASRALLSSLIRPVLYP